MARIVHFEINTPDVEATTTFYSAVFGWQFNKWEGGEAEYWLVTTGDDDTKGINGGLMSVDDWPQTVNTMEVDSVDAFTEKITAHGGEVVVSKMAIKGAGYSAYFKDPSGVAFGVFQPDETAA